MKMESEGHITIHPGGEIIKKLIIPVDTISNIGGGCLCQVMDLAGASKGSMEN
jgi:hypothetical protein